MPNKWNPDRELALATIRTTKHVPNPFDFLTHNGIATPVPAVSGSLGEAARVFFPGLFLGMPCDLMVVWTIADFPDDRRCSTYYDPTSPWYQVFYGAYGIQSHKPGDVPWGYDANGQPDFAEIFEVPAKDYNDLTAGQLGCPPAKRCFAVLDCKARKDGQWDVADVRCRIPSGIHHAFGVVDEQARFDAWLAAEPPLPPGLANPFYYLIFGVPDPRMVAKGHPEYEPVTMRGELHFRAVPNVKGKPITLVWGACCRDTPAGQQLAGTIIAALRAEYP